MKSKAFWKPFSFLLEVKAVRCAFRDLSSSTNSGLDDLIFQHRTSYTGEVSPAPRNWYCGSKRAGSDPLCRRQTIFYTTTLFSGCLTGLLYLRALLFICVSPRCAIICYKICMMYRWGRQYIIVGWTAILWASKQQICLNLDDQQRSEQNFVFYLILKLKYGKYKLLNNNMECFDYQVKALILQ